MKQKRSAKDIAFEKERMEFRSEIKHLKKSLNEQQIQMNALNEIIRQQEMTILEQTDWINRLLEYTELSETDMKMKIQREKAMCEMFRTFDFISKIWI